MPKVTEEFLVARREEIIDACAKLYENTLRKSKRSLSRGGYGIYPYAVVSEKQKRPWRRRGDFAYHSVYEITFNCLKKLLGTDRKERQG